MKNEKGFTLVEVLASLVIISIVLVSFMVIFGNTNRLAVTNSEKLVVINLADAYLERVKVNPNEFINNYPPAPPTSISNGKTLPPYKINDKFYRITIDVSQNSSEVSLSLLNVKVSVQSTKTNMKSTVEGYVNYND
ncbi:prepilin-type N-terminal cleavage/methylation domain-containing protein [Planococcus sp. NCCP-2050]|uniref:type IV pilus modification PilV family protein n=1 Tax=Planococcus sp. NCCP-2050 TaxID=2944679 RepID=UPI00203D7D87|nr:type II secretion system protein [Planococcus sp. NCCP-2050]GKW46804.1 hypothetical protein NCCP2050_24960 [Planococcus sp. NCCP-2050]